MTTSVCWMMSLTRTGKLPASTFRSIACIRCTWAHFAQRDACTDLDAVYLEDYITHLFPRGKGR